MSQIFIIRHGQAGTRQNYDTLSELGRKQSRLLGEFLAGQQVRFAAVFCGAMERQRVTLNEVRAAFRESGAPFPEPVIDPGWNEFDLFGIYDKIGPRLCSDDPAFRDRYAMERQIAQSHDAQIHRQWSHCDAAMVRAWIESRYEVDIESWPAFLARVRGNRERIPAMPDGEAVAVFTSATPMSIWVAAALRADERKIMRLTGTVFNSAVTVLRIEDGDLDLVSFNTTPHLTDPALRTLR